jgi:hypothetical protein
MGDRLSLLLTADGISLFRQLAGKSYAGTELGYEFIAPDPLNLA